MATVAETAGSMMRTRAVALMAKKRGHEVVFCAGQDINYRPLEGIKNFQAPVPSPLGLPFFIGKRAFSIAKRLGLQQRIKITDFEQVLHIIGALKRRFFARDVCRVREAIRVFQPDIVFAEHRLSPLVAARLEGVKAATVYSAPIHHSRLENRSGRYSRGVIGFVAGKGLPSIVSALDVFDWPAVKIIPSSPELEPLEGENVVHVGPLIENVQTRKSPPGKNIIAYMGNSMIGAKSLVKILTESLGHTAYRIYISTKEMAPFSCGNIHVARRFDFDDLLGEALVFISHGGQNSMMQSLMSGVPLLVCPGEVFERRYNAASVTRLRAGIQMDVKDFTPLQVLRAVDEFEKNPIYRKNAREAGGKLALLGGASKVVDVLEELL